MSIKKAVKMIPGVTTVRNLQLAFKAPLNVICESHKKIRSYKNKYLGKRCFVVGNGPSLTASDLDLIKNEISFAANTIYKIFPMTEWRPTFYCVQDENVLRDIVKDDLKTETEACEAAFIRMYSSRIVREEGLDLNNIIYVPIWSRIKKNYSAPFSKRADRFVYDGSMVTYLSLQLAVFMGFSEIYLIGMDHNFPFHRKRNGEIEENDKSIPVHFWESADKNTGNIDLHSNYHELAENSYREVARVSKKCGTFKVYNATRGGKLEVFERVNLDDIVRG
ncbi:MAG: DUF115 domain-containing protein [Lachnospiraceae bacterium]|nr:DUF115 domain-containing protein [Lachnospiraceae bacterium]